MRKIRLDQLLVSRGLAENPSRARALLLEGRVFSGDRRLDKGGMLLDPETPLEVRSGPRWVSRGALKLLAALDTFGIDPAGKIAVDIGASTGGFTQVLLERGAARVYAVDVGHGQLDWRLRHDPRVVVLERTNARYLDRSHVPEPVDLLVCDASFISLRTLLPAPLALAAPRATLVALIKPQFEVGKGRVGKGGVVRDPALHAEVCANIRNWLEQEMGWRVLGTMKSPIVGPAGNCEFLTAAIRTELRPADAESPPRDRG
ncbi:16S/23S rRNA (cytidine-2'-O)-methyltransferase TlyA [bacterium HR40]|nr:16S/23S rRNA (cytidine-2'-O)-methyltransferase TlyA [bacterium HR40]